MIFIFQVPYFSIYLVWHANDFDFSSFIIYYVDICIGNKRFYRKKTRTREEMMTK